MHLLPYLSPASPNARFESSTLSARVPLFPRLRIARSTFPKMITDTHIFASLSTRLFAVGSKAGAFRVGCSGERGRDEKSGWMSWVSPCAPYQPQFRVDVASLFAARARRVSSFFMRDISLHLKDLSLATPCLRASNYGLDLD